MLVQQVEAVAHQLVVVGFVARGARERLDSGLLGERDPDFGDEDPFEVEADDVHAMGGSGREEGIYKLRRTAAPSSMTARA